MSSNKILGDRDVNAALADGQPLGKDVKSMEYHRQVLQSRIAQEPYSQTIRLSLRYHHEPLHSKALRAAQQASHQSLFAQASSKKLNNDENLFGTRSAQLDNPLGARSVKTERTLTSRLR
ncbi:hypothetical protein THARTR1_06096 [Trichoderma harzianum]|uniref:Uncharacterized protein n=1 Tax=Trichoderma harzianum TaxID=5544 RepID=A0A2K0U6I9_TRIHA|nr:hypothetical protein THARTR1_06096 [Trichoderma harzianum]